MSTKLLCLVDRERDGEAVDRFVVSTAAHPCWPVLLSTLTPAALLRGTDNGSTMLREASRMLACVAKDGSVYADVFERGLLARAAAASTALGTSLSAQRQSIGKSLSLSLSLSLFFFFFFFSSMLSLSTDVHPTHEATADKISICAGSRAAAGGGAGAGAGLSGAAHGGGAGGGGGGRAAGAPPGRLHGGRADWTATHAGCAGY